MTTTNLHITSSFFAGKKLRRVGELRNVARRARVLIRGNCALAPDYQTVWGDDLAIMDDAIEETARLHRWAQRVISVTEERVLLPSPSIFTARQHGGAHFVPIAEDSQSLVLQVKMIVEIAEQSPTVLWSEGKNFARSSDASDVFSSIEKFVLNVIVSRRQCCEDDSGLDVPDNNG